MHPGTSTEAARRQLQAATHDGTPAGASGKEAINVGPAGGMGKEKAGIS